MLIRKRATLFRSDLMLACEGNKDLLEGTPRNLAIGAQRTNVRLMD